MASRRTARVFLFVAVVGLSCRGATLKPGPARSGHELPIYPFWRSADFDGGVPTIVVPPKVTPRVATLVAPGFMISSRETSGVDRATSLNDDRVWILKDHSWLKGRFVDWSKTVAVIKINIKEQPLTLDPNVRSCDGPFSFWVFTRHGQRLNLTRRQIGCFTAFSLGCHDQHYPHPLCFAAWDEVQSGAPIFCGVDNAFYGLISYDPDHDFRGVALVDDMIAAIREYQTIFERKY